MNIKQDWLMRQIEMTVQFVARMVFKKDSIQYEIPDTENLSATDLLHNKLKELLLQFKICEAEDLLFSSFEDGNKDFLMLALDFYQTVNQMDEDELESNDLSREEIKDGLDEIARRYGLSLPEL